MKLLQISHRVVLCNVAPAKKAGFSIVRLIRDAGHSYNTPDRSEADRKAELVGISIRRAYNARGAATVRNDVLATITRESV